MPMLNPSPSPLLPTMASVRASGADGASGITASPLVRCGACRAEFLVALRCKGRHLCPSCHARRPAEWSLRLDERLLARVVHREIVLTPPRRLRACRGGLPPRPPALSSWQADAGRPGPVPGPSPGPPGAPTPCSPRRWPGRGMLRAGFARKCRRGHGFCAPGCLPATVWLAKQTAVEGI